MSAVRIGRVRLKSGGEVRLLRPEVDANRGKAERFIRETLDQHPGSELAGYAFVTWGPDGGSTCTQWVGPGSTIPTILIPDFVRNRLLAATAVSWTIQDVNEQLGFSPSDDPTG